MSASKFFPPHGVAQFLLRMPAYLINGAGVALGVALIQLLAGVAGGPTAALSAAGGAIFASLADLPIPTRRSMRRVFTAAVVGCLTSILMMALRAHPLALGIAIVVLGFVAAMALAWGPRAGPISFVPILSLVFTLAAPPVPGLGPLLVHAGWTALGAALYLGWAILVSMACQRRYRSLALAGALSATADLLRSRAALLADDPLAARGAPPLQDWISRQISLDERLQSARDFLFVAPNKPDTQRRVAVLLLAIDLRDALMASELDLDLLRRDAAVEQLRATLSANLNRIADAVEHMAQAVRLGVELTAAPSAGPVHTGAPVATLEPEPSAPQDSAPESATHHSLRTALLNRSQHMNNDLARMQRAMQGLAVDVPLDHAELQLFVSAEGWPWPALRRSATLRSPVLRHALRAGAALGSAYFLALALPWASHPHWLVLSVAVVLRGNLEQTLSRRDARIAGTMIGCVLVLGLAELNLPWLSAVAFMLAVGVAHSFVLERYLVTAAAASVMALLQAHLAHPEGGFGLGERLADTVLGALLAWGFSYVLPSWERRGLPRLVERVLRSLRDLAREALHWPESGAPDIPLRLARREVYDAIGAIAASAKRTGVEPEHVRVPMYALASLLTQCHVLLAQLAAVRVLLTRRAERFDPAQAIAALRDAANDIERLLSAPAPLAADLDPVVSGDDTALPADNEAMLPWLQRRLQMTARAAARVTQAAAAVRAVGRGPTPR